MNKKEISKIILILKTAYPYAFKDMGENEIESMVNLYQELFKDDSYQEVSKAIVNIINTSEYMPTIATIKSKIYDIKHPIQESNTELWESLLSAIRNSSYYAEREFEKLPPLVKEFIQSPQQLQSIAREMTSDEIHTVFKGQFLKQIENIKQNFKEYEITGNKKLLQEKGIYQIEEVID